MIERLLLTLFAVSPFVSAFCLYLLLKIELERCEADREPITSTTYLVWLFEILITAVPIVNFIALIVIFIYKFTQIKH